MAGIMVSRPTKMISGKEAVNASRKPKEWRSKLMGIIRGKEEVNGLSKPKKWVSKFIGSALRPISPKGNKRQGCGNWAAKA